MSSYVITTLTAVSGNDGLIPDLLSLIQVTCSQNILTQRPLKDTRLISIKRPLLQSLMPSYCTEGPHEVPFLGP